MTPDHAALLSALFELEAELRRLGLWEDESPAAERLASRLPFCHDTLEFHQWLQWVFVPRLGELLGSGAELPHASGIAPLAEMTFAECQIEAEELVSILGRIDALLNASAPRIN